MSAKDILVRHGEKIALGITGLICGLVLFNTFVNDEVRPSAAGATAKDIKEAIASITDYRMRARPPLLKPVPEYAQRMKDDFARTVPARPTMAWTTVHPDMGPVTPPDTFLYVYELMPPILEVKDAIGSLAVLVGLPESVRGNERLSDLPKVEWTRKDVAPVSNHAEIVGAIIEQRIGKDAKAAWMPVAGGKLIPVEALATPIIIDGTVDFETYTFRARLLAKATGFRPGSESAGDVLVAEGRILPADVTPDEDWWRRLEARIFGKAQDYKGFISAGSAPDGLVLGAEESAYAGPLAEPIGLVASSAIRFQLEKLVPDPQNPNAQLASILLTKLLRQDGKEAWLPMQKFTVPVGAVLGGPKTERHPLLKDNPKDNFDLATPFKLEKLEKDVIRIIYYEIKLTARTDGKPGKALSVNPSDKTTDVATFLNTRTGDKVRLAKLVPIYRPGDPEARIYPDLNPVNEKQAFEDHPGTFTQQVLLPDPPLKHAPETGPLEELRKKGDRQATTDTDYFEMPDGRLYFYNPLNRKVFLRLKPGATYRARGAPATSVVPEQAPPAPGPDASKPREPGGTSPDGAVAPPPP